MTFLSFKENSKYQLRQMVLEWTAEILQKADFTNIGSQPQRTQKKKVSNGRKEEKKSQSANYRMILWELAPTDCGLGSVVPLMLSHTNQLCNRILQRKLKFLTPTVCQRVVVCFFFFFSECNSWSQKSSIFMALIQLLPVRGAEGEVCV